MHLYISDLDGTLLDPHQLLTAKSARLLNELIDSERLDFTVATARSIDSCRPVIRDLRLKLPLIVHNGALIFDPGSGKYIKENILNVRQAAEIISVMGRAGLRPFVFSHSPRNGNKVYYTGVSNGGERMYVEKRLAAKDPRLTLVGDESEIPETDAIEVAAIDTWERLAPVYERFRLNRRLTCQLMRDIYSGYHFLEIGDACANKGEGVRFLREWTGASKISAFGDNLNDAPLFDASDECFAVANADPSLKDMCDEVIGSNDQDGVACFLQKRFYGKYAINDTLTNMSD